MQVGQLTKSRTWRGGKQLWALGLHARRGNSCHHQLTSNERHINQQRGVTARSRPIHTNPTPTTAQIHGLLIPALFSSPKEKIGRLIWRSPPPKYINGGKCSKTSCHLSYHSVLLKELSETLLHLLSNCRLDRYEMSLDKPEATFTHILLYGIANFIHYRSSGERSNEHLQINIPQMCGANVESIRPCEKKLHEILLRGEKKPTCVSILKISRYGFSHLIKFLWILFGEFFHTFITWRIKTGLTKCVIYNRIYFPYIFD